MTQKKRGNRKSKMPRERAATIPTFLECVVAVSCGVIAGIILSIFRILFTTLTVKAILIIGILLGGLFAAILLVILTVILYRNLESKVKSGTRIFIIVIGETLLIGLIAPLPFIPKSVPPPTATVYDFENDVQGWGEHPENSVHFSGQGVNVYRDNLSPIRNTGDSSLQFTPTAVVGNNTYVTVLEDARGSKITAYMFLPSGSDITVAGPQSTARIIVWDKEWKSYESDFVELKPGEWQTISWDLRGEEWPGPWREFGIHLWFAVDFKGPIYIDTVTLEK